MWWEALSVSLVVLVFVLMAVVVYGTNRWHADTKDLCERMESARVPISPAPCDPRALDGLPAPVQRYLRAVVKEGQPLAAAVSIEHTGTFNMSETGERWKPFSSTQRVIIRRPGFVWNARIRMLPGMTVHVHDAYIAGEGILAAKLFGFLTVMNQPGTPELAHGELMRFLAEAVWYPTAFLPGQGVVWEAIDDHRAGATLADGTTTVALVFHFDAQGLISSVSSEGRSREVHGVQVSTPWQGRFWDYHVRDGMVIPLGGEVEWLLSDGARPYWRGHITRIRYEFAQ